MLPLAKSLRPNPERELLDKEAEAERMANQPAPIHESVFASLDSHAMTHGMGPTHKAAARWVRENRPQRIRPANDAKAEAEKLFRPDQQGKAGR